MSNFKTTSLEPLTPPALLGQWRVDEAATLAQESARLGVSSPQLRQDMELSGYLGVTIAFGERAFTLSYDDESEPRHVASYTHATGIPCGINQLWLQYTWDAMIAQPFQYVLLTQHEPDLLEIEWPNDRSIHYRRVT